MNRLISAKPLLAAALAFGALAATSAAHARTDVVLSIQAPFGYVQPQPVYVQPQPVYVQPRTVYAQPQPYYVEPQPVYYPRHHRHHDRYGAWGDADRDGVPNRYDRAPNNPYRR
jgi:hypothetical protein